MVCWLRFEEMLRMWCFGIVVVLVRKMWLSRVGVFRLMCSVVDSLVRLVVVSGLGVFSRVVLLMSVVFF